MNTRVGATRRAGRRLALLATAALMYPVTAAPNAPRAEIQVNLCGDPARIIERLQLKAHASVRAVWYFDTPDLALRARGIVFRLRDNREGADLTLKAAGQECATVPSALLPRAEGKCENADFMHLVEKPACAVRGIEQPVAIWTRANNA